MSLRALALAVLEHVTRGELTGAWAPAVDAAERLAEGLRAKVDAAPRTVAPARGVADADADEDDDAPRPALDPYEADRAWR